MGIHPIIWKWNVSPYYSSFPENSGLKFDQFICKCLCPATSWCWGCSCPCLWLCAAAPSSLFAIFLFYKSYTPICHISPFLQLIPATFYLQCDKSIILFLNLNLPQTLEIDTSWQLVTILFLSRLEAFPICWIWQSQRLLLLLNFDLLMVQQNFQS